jgi:hypothetical protein
MDDPPFKKCTIKYQCLQWAAILELVLESGVKEVNYVDGLIGRIIQGSDQTSKETFFS